MNIASLGEIIFMCLLLLLHIQYFHIIFSFLISKLMLPNKFTTSLNTCSLLNYILKKNGENAKLSLILEK